MLLKAEEVLALLGEEGPFTSQWPGYIPRDSQKEMARDLIDAVNHQKVALIEAETGLGKSLAYLLPAVLFAFFHKKKVAISTKTIQLQEQLLTKEIPALLKILQIDLKPTIMKGMSNYLCLKKIEETYEERLLLDEKAQEEIEQLRAGQLGGKSRQELHLSRELKERVFAESDNCQGSQCPYYEQCHFFKARKEAELAPLLIVNHSLFFQDLKIRLEKDRNSSPLSQLDLVIFDEAHHIENVALEHMAMRFSLLSLIKNLNRLSSDRSQGKLFQLRDGLLASKKIPSSQKQPIVERMAFSISQQEHALFLAIYEISALFQKKEVKISFDEQFTKSSFYQESFLPLAKKLTDAISSLSSSLQAHCMAMEPIIQESPSEKIKILHLEIQSIKTRLDHYTHFLASFLAMPLPISKVRWSERGRGNEEADLSLIIADLDLSELLRKELFEAYSTVILTSATLRTSQDFSYVKTRLGLQTEKCKKSILEKHYPSPFDYKKNALFLVPSHLALPDDPLFYEESTQLIQKVIFAAKGGALVLFTAYEMMRQFAEKLAPLFRKKGLIFFMQGEGPRQTLIEEFQKSSSSVLFGTDTFWEGVDIRKNALRLVILVKLPFKTPSEPLTQAQHALLLSQEKNPFLELSLPEAIVKFKQGFGRLIRHPKDRGIVLCLDRRLYTKSYGARFIASLPNCEKIVTSNEDLQEVVLRFFSSSNAR